MSSYSGSLSAFDKPCVDEYWWDKAHKLAHPFADKDLVLP